MERKRERERERGREGGREGGGGERKREREREMNGTDYHMLTHTLHVVLIELNLP